MTLGEFCAVVLAGGEGGGVLPLTGVTPKCMLHVGHAPLIYFTLLYIEKQGFEEVYIVTQEGWQKNIENSVAHCGSRSDCEKITLRLNFLYVKNIKDVRSASVFSLIQDYTKFYRNIVLFGGDLYGAIDPLYKMISLHRKNEANLTVYMTPAVELKNFQGIGKAFLKFQGSRGSQNIYLNDKDIVGLNEEEDRLIFLANEKEVDDIILDPEIFYRFGSFKVYTSLHDLHIYIINSAIIDTILQEIKRRDLESLRVDVLPFLIKRQFQVSAHIKRDIVENVTDEGIIPDVQTLLDICGNDYVYSPVLDFFNSSTGAPVGSINELLVPEEYKFDVGRCSVYINRSSSYSFRVNNMASFKVANSLVFDELSNLIKPFCKPHKANKKKVGRWLTKYAKSFVDRSLKADNNIAISFTNIGASCTIGCRSRLTKCVILPRVAIGEDCVLDNCVIGSDVVIGSNCVLKDSIIGPTEMIQSGSKFFNEFIAGATEMLLEQ